MLLDENLPHLLRRELQGLAVRTVAEAGWAGTKNGELLRRASAEFEVFVTADRNLPHQHDLARLTLGVVVLAACSTKLEDLRSLAPQIVEAATIVEPGQVLRVPAT